MFSDFLASLRRPFHFSLVFTADPAYSTQCQYFLTKTNFRTHSVLPPCVCARSGFMRTLGRNRRCVRGRAGVAATAAAAPVAPAPAPATAASPSRPPRGRRPLRMPAAARPRPARKPKGRARPQCLAKQMESRAPGPRRRRRSRRAPPAPARPGVDRGVDGPSAQKARRLVRLREDGRQVPP